MIRIVVDYLPEYPGECPFAKHDSKYECDEKTCRDCEYLCDIREFVRRK